MGDLDRIAFDPHVMGGQACMKLTWVTVDGGLPAGVDVADRAGMHEWLGSQR